MGKRYYCDYCERSFKDDPEARKKHLSSLQHVKNRADHYSVYKDPETILREESSKTPCKRFMNFGECAFGHGCKFSHYSPYDLRTLRRMVAEKNHRSSPVTPIDLSDGATSLEEFFQEATSSHDGTAKIVPRAWRIAPELKNYRNLPPSMWSFEAQNFADSDFGQWGAR